MSAATVYVVMGNCGEYSDYREWCVCAYEDELLARAHAEAAKRWHMENPEPAGATLDWPETRPNPYDEGGLTNEWPGYLTDWTVVAVPIRNKLPLTPPAPARTTPPSTPTT